MEYQPLTPAFIDQIFPYFVFIYGSMVTIVLNIPKLLELSEQKLPPSIQKQMNGHRVLALACMCIGFVWSLQNLWFS